MPWNADPSDFPSVAEERVPRSRWRVCRPSSRSCLVLVPRRCPSRRKQTSGRRPRAHSYLRARLIPRSNGHRARTVDPPESGRGLCSELGSEAVSLWSRPRLSSSVTRRTTRLRTRAPSPEVDSRYSARGQGRCSGQQSASSLDRVDRVRVGALCPRSALPWTEAGPSPYPFRQEPGEVPYGKLRLTTVSGLHPLERKRLTGSTSRLSASDPCSRIA